MRSSILWRPFVGLVLTLPALCGASEPASPEVVALWEAARDPQTDFFAAYDAARDAGVPAAQLLEGRLIKLLGTGDLGGLLAQLPALEANKNDFLVGFDPKGESIYSFSSIRQVDGLIYTLQAVKAYQAEDWDTFEAKAKEAYWAWPEWTKNFQIGELVAQLRAREVIDAYVADLVLPLDLSLRDLDGATTTLGDLVDGKKALLLDFWASWCGPCLRLMPELQQRANSLPAQGIHVVAVNTDETDPLTKAAEVKTEKAMDLPWLVEMEERPLSSMLMIDSIPRVILMSPEGEILFNGHPMDDELTTALEALGVTLEAETAEDAGA